jgi:hypothetical protein
MKRVSIFLTESEIEGLRKVSERTGVRMAEIIRRLIDNFLKTDKKRKEVKKR